jgi:hypothetical protein
MRIPVAGRWFWLISTCAAWLIFTPAAAIGQTAPREADPAVVSFFRTTEVSGFVDTYYSYNFNKPTRPCAVVGGVAVFTCLRNFDVAHNAFSLNLAGLKLEKKPAPDRRVGFRIDLAYGPAAAMIHATEPGGIAVFQHVEQAFVSYLAPVGSGLRIDVGKFVSPADFEVIETKDDWNYSRGLLFTLATPYYHVGVRGAYTVNDRFAVTGYLLNGWNNAVDNNTAKTAAVSGTIKLTPSLSATQTYIIGPEQPGNNRRLRQMWNLSVTYTPGPQLTFVQIYDWDYDREPTSGYWGEGIGTYVRYRPNTWFALTPRAELYFDKGAFITGVRQRVKEVTVTGELTHKDGLTTMIEYRRDFSNFPYFTDRDRLRATSSQDTVTVGLVYAFSTRAP